MKGIINRATLSLENIATDVQSVQEIDFDECDSSDLNKYFHSLDRLYMQADDTSFAISTLMKKVDALRVSRAAEETEENSRIDSKHMRDLNSWWNSTRI